MFQDKAITMDSGSEDEGPAGAAIAQRPQQVAAGELGVVPPVASAPPPPEEAEESLCVVCLDAPRWYAMVPCGHQCVCETCAKEFKPKTVKKRKTRKDCPVCRAKIDQTIRVFL